MGTLLALVLLAAPPAPDPASLRTGDLVFQTSRSSQAAAIRAATGSPLTHVGVVVMEGSQAVVVEAERKVTRTPFARFAARGEGGAVLVLRLPGLDEGQRAAIAGAALAALGRPYDPFFLEGGEALYCTELVDIAFRAARIQLQGWRKARELDLGAVAVRALIGKRWRAHPLCRGTASVEECLPRIAEQRLLTPADLAADSRLTVVASSMR